MLTQKQAQEILEILYKGNDYAELFIEKTIMTYWNNFDNKRFTPSKGIRRGTGIRTWKGKDVTYVSIDSISYEDIKAKALEIQKEGKVKKVKFTDVYNGFKENDFGKWDIKNIKEKLETMINEAKATDKLIVNASASANSTQRNTLVANTNGSFIEKTDFYSTISCESQSQKGKESSSAHAKVSKGMTFAKVMSLLETKEIINEFKWAPQLAVKLLDAPRIKSGEMNVILPSGFGAVLFHEAVGHPLEATQVAIGTSLFTDKLGEKVATDIVTLIDDGTIEGERGTSPYDDEGNKNKSRVLIENGVLKSYLIDQFNGDALMNMKANGAGRRENYRYAPTSRMSNTFIKKGTSKVEDIIKATKHGFYAKQLGGGQVDPFSGKFNFGVTEGYLIEDGKIKHLVKNATLIGNGIEALWYIDMIADDFKIDAGTCGSKSGMIPVTVGQPTLRITKMIVGGE